MIGTTSSTTTSARHHARTWAWVATLAVAVSLAACVEPGAAPSSSLPPGVEIARDPLLHDVYFPITVGIHAGADCDTCHGAFDTFRNFTCFGCHEHDQAVTDPPHATIAGYLYDSPSCYGCHPRGVATEISRTEHDQYFLISAGTAHEAESCTTCHVNSADRKQVECITCHKGTHDKATTDATHGLIPNYAWTDAACRSCHPKGEVGELSRAEHDEIFFISAGTAHGEETCASCHTDASDRRHVECTTCHKGTHDEAVTTAAHRGITDYAWNDAACRTCHPKGEVGEISRVEHDVFFLISPGTAHADETCASCHLDPSDRSLVTCITCHKGSHDEALMATEHQGVTGYAWSDAACRTCHPRGEPALSRTEHDLVFLISAGTAHERTDCSSCHTMASDRTHVECITCHTGEHAQTVMNDRHGRIPRYAWNDPACLDCHPRGEHPELSRLEHTTFFPIVAGRHALSCVSCHPNEDDKSIFTCTTCHEHSRANTDPEHREVGNYVYSDEACYECHPQGRAED
ncbi:hypothetical protein L6R52_34825 [Myxococcota bacterium]|nr:hypothetical protein [Myxococcota bacterium]